jgi:rubrerythrin
MDLAKKMERPWMREVFEQFSREEEGHKEKLLNIKKGEQPFTLVENVADLKIGDYLVEEELNADMDYQQALIVAMKKEKASYRMYSDLAAATSSPELRTALLSLAQEEAKHKLRFEVEYDDIIFKEN